MKALYSWNTLFTAKILTFSKVNIKDSHLQSIQKNRLPSHSLDSRFSFLQ